jgi:hypothetical protein
MTELKVGVDSMLNVGGEGMMWLDAFTLGYFQATLWTVCKLVNNSSTLRHTSIFQWGKNVKSVHFIFKVIWYVLVCLSSRMCSSLELQEVDRLYSYFVFKSSSVIGWCPVNMNIAAPKIRTLQVDPKT